MQITNQLIDQMSNLTRVQRQERQAQADYGQVRDKVEKAEQQDLSGMQELYHGQALDAGNKQANARPAAQQPAAPAADGFTPSKPVPQVGYQNPKVV